MARLILITIILSVLGGSAAWAISTSAENERLATELESTVTANQTYVDAIAVMDERHKKLERSIIDRDKRNKAIQRELNSTKRRLIDASKNPTITVVEKECMDSPIPGPILNELRKTQDHLQDKPTSKDLPTSGFLSRDRKTAFLSRDMVGAGQFCGRTEFAYRQTKPGPQSNRGIL